MTRGVLQMSRVNATALGLGARDIPRKAKVLLPEFWNGYDTETLIYDCIWQQAYGRIRLFLPKLINFQAPLLKADFLVDSVKSPPKLRKFQRFDIIDLPARERPQTLKIRSANASVNVHINLAESVSFADRNVLYTMLMNDPLDWVQDWVLAHQRNHSADAVIIVNNGSTAYSSLDLLAVIQAVPGIAVANVIDAPLKYSPPIKTTNACGAASFLQTACMNLVKDRLLTKARAALLCDVDELVNAPSGQSIFDATVASPLKFKPFNGYWRFVGPDVANPQHRDHVHADKKNETCASKYCIVPNSPLGRMCWSVHGLENVNRRIFRPVNKFRFYHCRSISTSWKRPRAEQTGRTGHIDPTTQAFMTSTFD